MEEAQTFVSTILDDQYSNLLIAEDTEGVVTGFILGPAQKWRRRKTILVDIGIRLFEAGKDSAKN